MGHYQQFIKGFACIAQLLNGLLSGEGASRKVRMGVTTERCLESLQCSETGMHECSHPGLCHYTKEFLLETGASKEELGVVLFPKTGGWVIPPGHLW